jgi:hypothetical protein
MLRYKDDLAVLRKQLAAQEEAHAGLQQQLLAALGGHPSLMTEQLQSHVQVLELQLRAAKAEQASTTDQLATLRHHTSRLLGAHPVLAEAWSDVLQGKVTMNTAHCCCRHVICMPDFL